MAEYDNDFYFKYQKINKLIFVSNDKISIKKIISKLKKSKIIDYDNYKNLSNSHIIDWVEKPLTENSTKKLESTTVTLNNLINKENKNNNQETDKTFTNNEESNPSFFQNIPDTK
jgi:hypothetical protein